MRRGKWGGSVGGVGDELGMGGGEGSRRRVGGESEMRRVGGEESRRRVGAVSDTILVWPTLSPG